MAVTFLVLFMTTIVNLSLIKIVNIIPDSDDEGFGRQMLVVGALHIPYRVLVRSSTASLFCFERLIHVEKVSLISVDHLHRQLKAHVETQKQ